MHKLNEPDTAASSYRAAIEMLMADGVAIDPPGWLSDEAAIDYEAERERALSDPAGFWAEKAAALDWLEPWEQVLSFDPPEHRWFRGGKLNATLNTIESSVEARTDFSVDS